jgi:hypothetical protein
MECWYNNSAAALRATIPDRKWNIYFRYLHLYTILTVWNGRKGRGKGKEREGEGEANGRRWFIGVSE